MFEVLERIPWMEDCWSKRLEGPMGEVSGWSKKKQIQQEANRFHANISYRIFKAKRYLGVGK